MTDLHAPSAGSPVSPAKGTPPPGPKCENPAYATGPHIQALRSARQASRGG